MDAQGFDALARRLTLRLNRRRSLGLVATLGLPSLVAPDVTAARKKPCPPCKKRQKGKCKKTLPNGTACGADRTCQNGTCVLAAAPPPPPPPRCGTGGPCLVFVTSTTHPGNLKWASASGLEGADLICQLRAQAGNLPGTYKAWLSDGASTPATRFVQSTGPYQRLDGVTVADSFADLTTCDSSAPLACLDNPIDLMEDGVTRTNNASVWTNTVASGVEESPARDCDNWTKAERAFLGNVGMSDPIVRAKEWTDLNSIQFCDIACRLYCFQQSWAELPGWGPNNRRCPSAEHPAGQCLSYAGQRCEKNADCRSGSANKDEECFVPINGAIQSICTNGICGCRDGECCSDGVCPLGQFCDRDEYGLNDVCKTPDSG